jgi:hypothetical protein
MGNRCFKKKKESLSDFKNYTKLNQITIEKKGNCYICDNINVEGYLVQSVVKTMSIFVCKECKNLHN